MPAIAIAAEVRSLAALKIIPPIKALVNYIITESACLRSSVKLLPCVPVLPSVKAATTENSRMPIT